MDEEAIDANQLKNLKTLKERLSAQGLLEASTSSVL